MIQLWQPQFIVQESNIERFILPQGTWFDWWTGEVHEGECHILAHAPLEKMPLYVCAGAIIPMQPVMQYVDEQPLDSLTLRIYPGVGEFTLYEDDGKTFAYKNGKVATTNIRVYEEQQYVVEIGDRTGNWQPTRREIIIELVSIGQESFIDDGTARSLRFARVR